MCLHGLGYLHLLVDLGTVLLTVGGTLGWFLREEIRNWFNRGKCDGECDK